MIKSFMYYCYNDSIHATIKQSFAHIEIFSMRNHHGQPLQSWIPLQWVYSPTVWNKISDSVVILLSVIGREMAIITA